jgi:hypothetical protein
MHADLLVIAWTLEAKLQSATGRNTIERQEIAATQLRTVRGERVDFFPPVNTAYETVAVPSGGVAAHNEDIPVSAGPLALDAKEPRTQVEDEVIALVAKRL